ncbi:hypothetical protein BZA77DRAFT_307591 [Pyronema omphalodes]|nr:hypothetical protein BZA77DRAFT_307591 [Pyronema omphalodes]
MLKTLPADSMDPNMLHPSYDTSPSFPSKTEGQSPRIIPLSFSNLSAHDSTGAVLSIRKSNAYPSPSSSFHLTYRDASQSSMPSTSPQYHRRLSTSLSISPANHIRDTNSADGTGGSDIDSQEASPSSEVFPGGLEIPSRISGDRELCHRHHHRQSIDSTISIPCSDTSEIETSVDIRPCAPSMLIPLMDRAQEMRELLRHPRNQEWIELGNMALGEKQWRECEELWTGKDRQELGDMEWLKESRRLLEPPGCGGVCDGRLWHEFCGMVGWDGVLDDLVPSQDVLPSQDMGVIKEEEEDELVGKLE